ncbi:hypothetical protein LWI29_009874 [Acer saccharum]|uniref:Uncharacterized protein n=1 Tax=Acer saccharum TaxID=4024 RepID=A0AA39RGU4_ACESA|nr:hypothetical protein LWI29_009874 [Acer saccharum]
MFTNGTRHMNLSNEGHSRWHEADRTQTVNEEYNPNDTYNNSECKFHVPFAQGKVSTTPMMFYDNLVQPTDDLLHSELISLQVTYIMGKQFISVTGAEEFYKKYSYEFVTKHNHKLSTGNHSQFLRSHRNVTECDIAQVQSLRSVGMKTCQVMDQLVDQAGSYATVGHTRKDLQNWLDTIRRSASHNSDADSIISYVDGEIWIATHSTIRSI